MSNLTPLDRDVLGILCEGPDSAPNIARELGRQTDVVRKSLGRLIRTGYACEWGHIYDDSWRKPATVYALAQRAAA